MPFLLQLYLLWRKSIQCNIGVLASQGEMVSLIVSGWWTIPSVPKTCDLKSWFLSNAVF